MGRKKSKTIILILIILLIICIILAGVAYCYFATDLLKSNKQLFFKYAGQIGNAENGFIENSLTQYLEKKENTPYTNEGEITLNITENGENLAEYQNLNNFNISFSGQTDKASDKTVQDISLNYSDEVNFPISYKKIENTIGLQTKYVSSKYLAVEADNTENFEPTSIIPVDTLETEIPFSIEDLKIINTYLNAVNSGLQNSNFVKLEDTKYVGYQLNLTGEEIKNIIKQLVETLKNDETTLTKINEFLEVQDDEIITVEMLDDFIQELDEEDFSEETLKVTVYQKNGQTQKIEYENNDYKVQIEKAEENNVLNYNISLEILEENVEIALLASFEGLQTMQEIKETYAIELITENDETLNYKYQFNNNITFTEEVNIDEFSDENAMILTKYDEETVRNFMDSVEERIELVNKQQMEKIGAEEDENPLGQMILPFIGIAIFDGAVDAMESTSDNMQTAEIEVFNNKFLKYESTNLGGPTVKGLLTTIESNNGLDVSDEILDNEGNASSNNHLITEINFNGEEYEVNQQNILFIKNEVKLDGAYRVEFEMDENTGAIYRAVINEKVGE